MRVNLPVRDFNMPSCERRYAMNDKMIEIQKLCTKLNEAISSLKEYVKTYHSIENDEKRNECVYYSEKMNEVRSYLVYLSKEIDNRRTYLRNEIAFYDFDYSNKKSF